MHQVTHDDSHLHDEFPVSILLLTGLCLFIVSDVLTLIAHTVLAGPCHSLLVLHRVVDTLSHTADDFCKVNTFVAHTEVLLEEVRVNDGTSDTHAGTTHREIRLAAHGSYCLSCSSKAQNLLCYISRDRVIFQVLYIMTVDAESWQSLLGMSCENSSQINSAWTLCTVESPNSLWPVWIHIHSFCTIAPAGSNGDGRANTLALKLFCASSTFCYTTDGTVSDHALYRRAVAIT